jgi:DNA polymerase III subunit gamma/tau
VAASCARSSSNRVRTVKEAALRGYDLSCVLAVAFFKLRVCLVMSYLVLARRYRPQNFAEVTGQEHVTQTLQNSVKRNKIAHAYLFAGLRGVGKTSIARIFAKALNCCSTGSAEPCGECVSCREIKAGNSLAVREIDGASHNSVDNVRELIESFRTVPPSGYRYKVYIIDEVHMLSTAAFNALLKSLEEPPPHTVFILATTELHKIPDTILSRCQRHDLRALSYDVISRTLAEILTREGVSFEPTVVALIARLAEGSMRDAQSLLERLLAYSDNHLTLAAATSVFGVVSSVMLRELVQAIIERDPKKALGTLQQACSQAVDISLLLKEFVGYWHTLLWVKFGDNIALGETGVGQDEVAELQKLAQSVSESDMHDLVHIARSGADEAMRSFYPQHVLEATIVRMATRQKTAEMAELLAHLNKLLSSGEGSGSQTRQAASKSDKSPTHQTEDRPTPYHTHARKSQAKQASPVSTPVTEDAPPQQNEIPQPKVDLDWREFVLTYATSRSPMIGEYLKRLQIKTFTEGILRATGPEFSINSLQNENNKTKLAELLSGYSGEKGWRVDLKASQEAPVASSNTVQQEVQREQLQNEQQRRQQIQEHPTIKTLQKIFPGSSIETQSSTKSR